MVGSAALTGLSFTLVQVWAPASSLYEHVFGLARWPVDAAVATIGDQPVEGPAPVRLWPDATDLLVLPVLLVVPWLARRRIPDAPVAPPRGGATVAR